MRREYQERFPRHRLQRESLVDDPDMHHGMCVTPMPWCVSGLLTRGENVPGIPDALATRNSTYLARGPLLEDTLHPLSRLFIHKALHWSPSVHHSTCRVFVWKNVDPMLFWLQRAVLKFYLVVYSPLVCECKNNMAFKLKTLCLLFTMATENHRHGGRAPGAFMQMRADTKIRRNQHILLFTNVLHDDIPWYSHKRRFNFLSMVKPLCTWLSMGWGLLNLHPLISP